MLSGRPGPVNIDVPFNVFQEEDDVELPPAAPPLNTQRSGASPDEISHALDMILKAQRPVIFIGHGVTLSEASRELTEFAKKLGIPVISSPNGMALAHVKRIADATDLPLIVFQYPLATGQGYPKDTLLEMCEAVPSIRAIKDWIGNVPHHEWHIRTLQNLPRPVNVLTTHSSWLLPSLVLGCNGLLSGSGSVVADLQARLFRAVRNNDLAEAKRINDRIEPTARVFYADPFVDMHNRMKEALVLLGKLPRAVVRPPLVKIERGEVARIRQALIEAGLLDKKARDAA